jgi:hypothetical protein
MAIELNGTTGITTPGLTNTGTETIVNLTTTGNTILGDASTDTLNVGNGGLVKDASGNVGIGTASPSAIGKVLNLYGSASVGSSIALQADNGAQFCTIYQGITAADPTSIFSNNGFKFATATAKDATGFSERMRLDASGNLGLGVTPSAWGGSYKAIQLGSFGALETNNGNKYVAVASNHYNNGSGDLYIANGFASRYYTVDGTHVWNTAPSGTAGNAITFTDAMTLDASGNLGVLGAITSNSKAVVTNITVASVPIGATTISTNLTTSIGTAAGGWLIYATMGRGGASVADTYSAVYLYSATESAYTPTLRTILASDAPGNNNGNIAISGTTVVVSWGGSRGPAAVTAIKLW